MNQQTVVDVIPIDLFTIERKTCGDTGVSMWVVIGHGDDDRTQRFDSYNTLDEAEKAYPYAVTIPSSRYCTCNVFTALNLK